MLSTARSFAANTLLNAIGKILFWGTSLLVSIYASRILDTSTFGKGQHLNWMVTIIWVWVNMGIPNILTRYVPFFNGKNQVDKTKRLLRYALSAGALVILLGTVMLYFIIYAEFEVRVLLMVLCLLYGLQSILQSIMLGFFRYRGLFIASLIASIATLSTFQPLISTYGLEGYLGVFVVHAFTSLVCYGVDVWLLFKKLKSSPEAAKLEETEEIIRFSIYIWLTLILASFLWQRTEIYFIREYLGTSSVAFFSVALALATLVAEPIKLLSSTLLPYFSRNQERVSNRQTYRLSSVFMAWLGFFICFFFAANSENLTLLIYGEKYQTSAMVAAILMAGFSFGVIGNVDTSLILGSGSSRFMFFNNLAGSVLAIIAGFVVIPQYGIVGAAYAKVTVQVLFTVISIWFVVKRLRFSFPIVNNVKSLVLSGVVAYSSSMVVSEGLLPLIIKFIACLLAYVMLSYLIKVFRQRDLEILRNALSKVLQTAK